MATLGVGTSSGWTAVLDRARVAHEHGETERAILLARDVHLEAEVARTLWPPTSPESWQCTKTIWVARALIHTFVRPRERAASSRC